MVYITMKTYSTGQVLRKLGIGRMTLLRWLKSEKSLEPRRIRNGGMDVRVWTARNVERVLRYKEAHYRKGRGRKKKPKA